MDRLLPTQIVHNVWRNVLYLPLLWNQRLLDGCLMGMVVPNRGGVIEVGEVGSDLRNVLAVNI